MLSKELTEHGEDCFFLDGLCVEELKHRMAQAKQAIREEEKVLAGCASRLDTMNKNKRESG